MSRSYKHDAFIFTVRRTGRLSRGYVLEPSFANDGAYIRSRNEKTPIYEVRHFIPIHTPIETDEVRVDWLGSLLGLGFVTCLLLALQWGGNMRPWNSPTIVALFIVSGVILAVFIVWERYKGYQAMLPLGMLARSTQLGCALAGVIHMLSISSCSTYSLYKFFEYLALLLATVESTHFYTNVSLIAAFIFFCSTTCLSGKSASNTGPNFPYNYL